MNTTQKYKFKKNIISDFSWKNITWNGWLLVMWEFFNETLNLESLLSSVIRENTSKKVQHSKVKVIIQKIYSILVWYTTDNIDVYIKNDPVFKAHLWTVVPRTTVNRVINSFGDRKSVV